MAQGDRWEQQDRLICTHITAGSFRHGAGQLMAVTDGHGGTSVAELIAEETAGLLENALRKYPGRVERALQEMVARLHERTEDETSGATLSAAYVPDDESRVYVSVIGDSPVLILDAEGKMEIGPLHNVRFNLLERSAALARGGIYIDGYLEDSRRPGEGLQMSRALGDRRLSRVLSREPDIYSIPIGPESFVMVGTDGLFDPYAQPPTADLERLAKHLRDGCDAQMLVDDALRRRTGDNVTVIVWRGTARG
jgi:serine/threonine protein phosphatase PrpC